MPPKPITLEERLKASVKSAAPKGFIPPAREKEIIPDLREMVEVPLIMRNRLQTLVTESAQLQSEESAAKKARKPITDQIKALVAQYQITKFRVGEVVTSYYAQSRKSIKEVTLRQQLAKVGLKQAAIDDVVRNSTVESTSLTLRISRPGETEDE